jgi:hypothetical protein
VATAKVKKDMNQVAVQKNLAKPRQYGGYLGYNRRFETQCANLT